MTTFDDRINAIKSINSDAVRFSEDKIFDNDGNEISINETDITNKIAELKTAYDNLEYQRKRAAEYPSLKEFAEAYCEKEIGGDSTKWDAYKTAYNKVRTDNPK
tara:strand:+ start:277 stop:588 length:312 start_codon:yes stop_codon:yes gene_type:complete